MPAQRLIIMGAAGRDFHNFKRDRSLRRARRRVIRAPHPR
jgi:hypothetical protein